MQSNSHLLPPRLPVAGVKGGQRLSGLVLVPREQRTSIVWQHVGEHGGRVAPRQPIRFQVKRAQYRGGGAERIERTARVAVKVQGTQLGRLHGAAGSVRRLQDKYLPPRVRQQVRGHQPVVPSADDHRVNRSHRVPPFHVDKARRPWLTASVQRVPRIRALDTPNDIAVHRESR
jgi:hypothetical protein